MIEGEPTIGAVNAMVVQYLRWSASMIGAMLVACPGETNRVAKVQCLASEDPGDAVADNVKKLRDLANMVEALHDGRVCR